MEITKKFIIQNEANIDDITLMDFIIAVMQEGLISGDQYCYVTTFKGGVVVEMFKKKYGYKVLVYRK